MSEKINEMFKKEFNLDNSVTSVTLSLLGDNVTYLHDHAFRVPTDEYYTTFASTGTFPTTPLQTYDVNDPFTDIDGTFSPKYAISHEFYVGLNKKFNEVMNQYAYYVDIDDFKDYTQYCLDKVN